MLRWLKKFRRPKPFAADLEEMLIRHCESVKRVPLPLGVDEACVAWEVRRPHLVRINDEVVARVNRDIAREFPRQGTWATSRSGYHYDRLYTPEGMIQTAYAHEDFWSGGPVNILFNPHYTVSKYLTSCNP